MRECCFIPCYEPTVYEFSWQFPGFSQNVSKNVAKYGAFWSGLQENKVVIFVFGVRGRKYRYKDEYRKTRRK